MHCLPVLSFLLCLLLVNGQVDEKILCKGYYFFMMDIKNCNESMKEFSSDVIDYLNYESTLNICGANTCLSSKEKFAKEVNKYEAISYLSLFKELATEFAICDILEEHKDDSSYQRKVIIIGNSESFYGVTASLKANNPNDQIFYFDFLDSNSDPGYFDIYIKVSSIVDLTITLEDYLCDEPCIQGKYRTSEGASCVACPEGSYCPDGVKIYECPAGTYSDIKGSTNCKPCPAGYECSDPSEPVGCEDDLYSFIGNGTCVSCPLNYECSSFFNEPTPCVEGQFSSEGDLYCHNVQATILEESESCDYECVKLRANVISQIGASNDYSLSYEESSEKFHLNFSSSIPDIDAHNLFFVPVVKYPSGALASTTEDDFIISTDDTSLKIVFSIGSDNLKNYLNEEMATDAEIVYSFKMNYEYYATESNTRYLRVIVMGIININKITSATTNFQVLAIEDNDGCDCTIVDDVPSELGIIVNNTIYKTEEFSSLNLQLVLNDELEFVHYLTETADQSRFSLTPYSIRMSYQDEDSEYFELIDYLTEISRFEEEQYAIRFKVPLYLVGRLKLSVISFVNSGRRVLTTEQDAVSEALNLVVVSMASDTSSSTKQEEERRVLLCVIIGLLAALNVILGLFLGCNFYKIKKTQAQKKEAATNDKRMPKLQA